CIAVCDMENVDAVGVHTGDSIVVAPCQSLSKSDYDMLKAASLKMIRALGIEGGCNVQFALDVNSQNYYVIEVNPRVSRSSALASKATGYPIARITSKIAIGFTLDELAKEIFEPAVNYIVVKYPRWPFDKFVFADKTIGTQMKATGEVMSIDKSFEGAILKAVRSLEIGVNRLYLEKFADWDNEKVLRELKKVNDERLFVIAEVLRRGLLTIDEIFDITKINPWFIQKIKNIADMENRLKLEDLTVELLREAKLIGLADKSISELTGKNIKEIRKLRLENKILPKFKLVDTCSKQFDATPYYYSTYRSEEDEVEVSTNRKVIVLGSGPIRIGQGVEFDYCSVHSVWALREMGIEAIIINNNPETVSTDFDISDKLYFEPLTTEDVLNIIDKEKPEGVIVQFGGQTAINLAASLAEAGVKIFGTSVDDIDRAEDRERFDEVLAEVNIPRPRGISVTNLEDAISGAAEIGYPVMVRPSYVLGGRAMEIVYNEDELKDYMSRAVKVTPDHPVLVDRYMQGTEVEVDAICDAADVVIPGIMEHVERAGVHSGDSIAVYPPQTLPSRVIYTISDFTKRLALALHVKGLLNIQYVVVDGKVYVIEVNPRSSRTVPFLSKVTNIKMVNVATRVALGHTLKEMGYHTGLVEPKPYTAVKAPVFSFAKMQDVDISLGPEMKSTGEVMGIDYHYARALYKAIVGAGMNIPKNGCILFTVADKDKDEMKDLAKAFSELGFKIMATEGTAKALETVGIKAEVVGKVHQRSVDIIERIKSGKIHMVVNTPAPGKHVLRDGFKIRRATVEHGIPCLTSLDTAWEVLRMLSFMRDRRLVYSLALQDYVGGGDELA
ncbi:MAG: carbamoyl-phosphate synthase large subunit, partial [Selenomonadaceae bacterium]|nr:carbamoyl-phosphate synthase large subunit [Selenomonadaceae bacterium]